MQALDLVSYVNILVLLARILVPTAPPVPLGFFKQIPALFLVLQAPILILLLSLVITANLLAPHASLIPLNVLPASLHCF